MGKIADPPLMVNSVEAARRDGAPDVKFLTSEQRCRHEDVACRSNRHGFDWWDDPAGLYQPGETVPLSCDWGTDSKSS